MSEEKVFSLDRLETDASRLFDEYRLLPEEYTTPERDSSSSSLFSSQNKFIEHSPPLSEASFLDADDAEGNTSASESLAQNRSSSAESRVSEVLAQIHSTRHHLASIRQSDPKPPSPIRLQRPWPGTESPLSAKSSTSDTNGKLKISKGFDKRGSPEALDPSNIIDQFRTWRASLEPGKNAPERRQESAPVTDRLLSRDDGNAPRKDTSREPQSVSLLSAESSSSPISSPESSPLSSTSPSRQRAVSPVRLPGWGITESLPDMDLAAYSSVKLTEWNDNPHTLVEETMNQRDETSSSQLSDQRPLSFRDEEAYASSLSFSFTRPASGFDASQNTRDNQTVGNPYPVSMSSSSVLHSWSTPKFSSTENSFRNDSGSKINESFSKERSESSSSIQSLSSVPPPSSSNPNDQLLYYLDYLKHRRHEVRLDSLRLVARLLSENSFPESMYANILTSLNSSLDVYENQEEIFSFELLSLFVRLGPRAAGSIPILMRILRDSFAVSLHEYAIYALFGIGEYGIQALVEGASEACTDWDAFVLTHVANHPLVLGLVILPLLVRECRHGHSDAARKEQVVRAIGLLHQLGIPAIPVLLDLLLSGVVDRFVVVQTLRLCGVEGERVLVDLIHSSKSARVRTAAAYGLGLPRIANPPLLKVLVTTEISSDLAAAPRVVFHASPPLPGSLALSEEGGFQEIRDSILALDCVIVDAREVISAVRRGLIEGDYNEPVESEFSVLNARKPAISGTLPVSEDVILSLLNGIRDEDASVRRQSCISIGCLGLENSSKIFAAFLGALNDPDANVREATCLTLGTLGTDVSSRSIPQVVSLLRDEFWKVRFAAVKTLGSFGLSAEAAVQPLVKCLKDGSVSRAEVAVSLALIGQMGVRRLIEILRDESRTDSQVKIACAYGLGFIDLTAQYVDSVVEALFLSSKDRTPLVRKAVIETLGRLGVHAKESVPYLRARSLLPFLYGFLKDKEAGVSQCAAEAIADTGAHGELLLIEGALKDSNPTIRRSSLYGLTRVGAQTIRTLLLACNDREPSVRQVAGEAILCLSLNEIFVTLSERPPTHRKSVIDSAREILNSPYPKSSSLERYLLQLIDHLEEEFSSTYSDVTGESDQGSDVDVLERAFSEELTVSVKNSDSKLSPLSIRSPYSSSRSNHHFHPNVYTDNQAPSPSSSPISLNTFAQSIQEGMVRKQGFSSFVSPSSSASSSRPSSSRGRKTRPNPKGRVIQKDSRLRR